jgi:antirestriction protein ArdC
MRHIGTPYKGINTILLWVAADANGYSNPMWMTFKQASALDAQVRKGEKSSLVTYADKIKRKNKDTGDDEKIFFLKGYNVFNCEQIDGLSAHYSAVADTPKLTPMKRDANAEAFIAKIGAEIAHGGNRAFYSPAQDRIQMPPSRRLLIPRATIQRDCMSWHTGRRHPSA